MENIENLIIEGEFAQNDLQDHFDEATPPERTKTAYKIFRVKDGRVYPLFVHSNNPIIVGKWLQAREADYMVDDEGNPLLNSDGLKNLEHSELGNLAFRPGWHSCSEPFEVHIGKKTSSTIDKAQSAELANAYRQKNGKKPASEGFIISMNDNFIWGECEISADINYTDMAEVNGYDKYDKKTGEVGRGNFNPRRAFLEKLPKNGYYEFRTKKPSNGDVANNVCWYISDKILIKRFMKDSEVREMNADKGFVDNLGNPTNGLPRYSGKDFSFVKNGLDQNGESQVYALSDKVKNDIENEGKSTIEIFKTPYTIFINKNGAYEVEGRPIKTTKKDSLEKVIAQLFAKTYDDLGMTESKNYYKKLLKEMSEYNEYILEWKKWVLKENEALQAGDTDKAGEYHMLATEAYKKYREDTRMTYEFESKSFGELNQIMENNLVDLFKSKSSLIKEYTQLIKEDKNLMAQYHFFTALNHFREGSDAKEYINEALNLVSSKINYKTINESNKKVQKLFAQYRNELKDEISDTDAKLFEQCNYVLTHKKKIANLNEMNNNLKAIIEYTSSNAKPQLKEDVNAYKLIEDYEKKVDSLLNEEEKTFVQEIMDAKKGSDNYKQKKLFEKFKGDCLTQINKMISESNETEKEQLLNIKEQLLNKEFCAETLIKDMAQLLEMRDVLMSE